MVRTYFKNIEKKEDKKLMKLFEKLGAYYYEDGEAIFITSKKYSDNHIAIRVRKDKLIDIGSIDNDYDFLEKNYLFFKEEIIWMVKIFNRLLKSKKIKLKKCEEQKNERKERSKTGKKV